jgi:hypothetical protein
VIDDGNDRERWPPEIKTRLPSFRQGSLVADPPFAYHAGSALAIWQATTEADAEGEETLLIDLDPVDCPPYGIITSHSCDVDEEGENRKPWVMIAPVYSIPGDQRLSLIRAWQMAFLAPVPGLGDEWVADLRIEFPVEKSWLVLRQPQDAYNTPEDFARFSRFCGDHRSRPALATSIYKSVIWDLRNRLSQLAKEDPSLHAAFAVGVQHMYVAVNGDALLSPSDIEAIFVSDAALPQSVRDWLNNWWVEIIKKRPPFNVLANRYLTYEDVSFREYRGWHPVDLSRIATAS